MGQVDGTYVLAWSPDVLAEEPYVALHRRAAAPPGAAPGHVVTASDMANGAPRAAVVRGARHSWTKRSVRVRQA
jgi:hypothetical protein